MRSLFQEHFPEDHPLRMLASDISSLTIGAASGHGLLTGTSKPWNLMANGEAQAWSTPTFWGPSGGAKSNEDAKERLVGWKGGSLGDQGFSCSTTNGVSLMFDDLVDSAIYANFLSPFCKFNSSMGITVLVLTDYGPAEDMINLAASMPGTDCGAKWVEDFFCGRNKDTTSQNIIKDLTGIETIDDVRTSINRSQKIQDSSQLPNFLVKCFASKRLLIWNYFPFQRGTANSRGQIGLPDLDNPRWFSLCDTYLTTFINAVGASKLIWATNQDVHDARGKHGLTYPIPTRCLHHPSAWKPPLPTLP